MAAGVFFEGLACCGRELVDGRGNAGGVCMNRSMRRRSRRSSNGFRGHDDGSNSVPLRKRGSQQIKHPRMASFGEQFARKLARQQSLCGRKTLVPVVCDEGNVCEDEVQPFRLAVGKGADHEGHPVLEAGGGEGRDARFGVDGWLDEVVLAAEVREEEGDAAEGLVVAGVEDACVVEELVCVGWDEDRGMRKGDEETTYVGRERIRCRACSGSKTSTACPG